MKRGNPMLNSHDYLLLSGLKSELGFVEVKIQKNSKEDISLIMVKNYLEKRVAELQKNDE